MIELDREEWCGFCAGRISMVLGSLALVALKLEP